MIYENSSDYKPNGFTWREYRTYEDTLSKLKINLSKKIKINGRDIFGEWTDRQTDVITKCQPCGHRNRRQTFQRLFDYQTNRIRSRGLKPSKLYDDNDEDEDDDSDDNDDV